MFSFATKSSLSKLRRKRGKVTYRSMPHGGRQNVGFGNMPLCQSVLWVLSQCAGWDPTFYPVLCPPGGGGKLPCGSTPTPGSRLPVSRRIASGGRGRSSPGQAHFPVLRRPDGAQSRRKCIWGPGPRQSPRFTTPSAWLLPSRAPSWLWFIVLWCPTHRSTLSLGLLGDGSSDPLAPTFLTSGARPQPRSPQGRGPPPCPRPHLRSVPDPRAHPPFLFCKRPSQRP